MITLEGVRQRFGEFALEVDLAVAKHDYLVILGPSGCGKSLLLSAIAGLYELAAGRVCLHDEDVTTAPPERRAIGFVFQRFSLFPHLSVVGNIEFGLRLRKTAKAARRARVDELIATLGLAPLLERPVATLSGGESQRVAIARALAPRPSILLLDEPLSLVDHNGRRSLREELRRIHTDLELTTVHVTHDREEARAVGSRCAVMLGGRIVQDGPLEQVFAKPSCLFVDRFLGIKTEPPPPPPGCTEICLAGNGRCDRPYQQPERTRESEEGVDAGS
jgi:putative spermidine/putrescine transport system ATP-binding protein